MLKNLPSLKSSHVLTALCKCPLFCQTSSRDPAASVILGLLRNRPTPSLTPADVSRQAAELVVRSRL